VLQSNLIITMQANEGSPGAIQKGHVQAGYRHAALSRTNTRLLSEPLFHSFTHLLSSFNFLLNPYVKMVFLLDYFQHRRDWLVVTTSL